MPEQAGVLCARCGEALPMQANGEDYRCRFCRAAAPPFEKAVAHGVYAGTLRALVHLLKYDGMEGVGRHFGVLLADQIVRIPELPKSLLVVPVPLWAAKRRQRGFNQAELLARSAVSAMRHRGSPLQLRVETGALARRRATESQAGLSPHQRRVNVRGAFFVPRPAAVTGQNVLLIDDIYTTGATARACARALRAAGAERVWVATVARAQREDALARNDFSGSAQQSAEIPMKEDVAFWQESRPDRSGGAAR